MSDALADAPVRDLDPFGFFRGHASAIKPLGGPDQGPDPKYAFHTPYLEFRPGPLVFTIRFEQLTATKGELGINLNGFIAQSGQNAALVDAARISLAELASSGTELTLRVNAIAGVTYAVFGYIRDLTDARAASLSITAQEFGTLENDSVPDHAYEATRFGTQSVERPSKLVDDNPPRFRSPVSQPMTSAQLEEASYHDRVRSLPPGITDVRRQWRLAFVLQALDCYGMLHPGAHGLALGDDGDILSSILTHRNGPVMVTFDPSRSCPPSTPPEAGRPPSHRDIDFSAIPDDLRGFDYLWSIGTANQMGTPADAGRFIENSMRCLRPGGLAIHIFDLAAPSSGGSSPPLAGADLHRSEIERLALTLIARTNEIAQLNFGVGDDSKPLTATSDAIPFGLIARRGATSRG